MKQFYTVPEFAQMLKISKAKAYRLLKEERINLVSFGPRSIRIPEDQIDSLLANHSSFQNLLSEESELKYSAESEYKNV